MPLRALAGAGEQGVEVGDAAVGDPRLRAVDARSRRRSGVGRAPQRRGVGTGLRLGQAVGADLVAGQHVRAASAASARRCRTASSGCDDRLCTLTATATAAQRAAISSSTCRYTS